MVGAARITSRAHLCARRISAVALLGLALCGTAAPAHAGPIPPVGFNSYLDLTQSDLSAVAQGWPENDGKGLRLYRQTLMWSQVEPNAPPAASCGSCPLTHSYTWTNTDALVGAAARSGVRLVPILGHSPGWIGPIGTTPPASGIEMQSWGDFVRAAAARYGPNGAYWRANPGVPYAPIRTWELWNEPNIHFFFGGLASPARYVEMLRAAAPQIRALDPGAEIVMGGLGSAGPPINIALGMPWQDFLPAVLRAPGVRDLVDSVGFHPYERTGEEVIQRALEFRAALAPLPRGADIGLWVNEFGWATQGSCGFVCALVGDLGWLNTSQEADAERSQRDKLLTVVNGLMVRRDQLRLRGLVTFVLADQPTDTQHKPLIWNDGPYVFAGLLKTNRPWTSPGRSPAVQDSRPKLAWRVLRDLVAGGQFRDPLPPPAVAPETSESPKPKLRFAVKRRAGRARVSISLLLRLSRTDRGYRAAVCARGTQPPVRTAKRRARGGTVNIGSCSKRRARALKGGKLSTKRLVRGAPAWSWAVTARALVWDRNGHVVATARARLFRATAQVR